MLRKIAILSALLAGQASAAVYDGRGAQGCAEGENSPSIMQITEEGIAYQEYSCAFMSEDLNPDPSLETLTLYCEESRPEAGEEGGWEDQITFDLRHLPGAIAFYQEGYEPDLITYCGR